MAHMRRNQLFVIEIKSPLCKGNLNSIGVGGVDV